MDLKRLFWTIRYCTFLKSEKRADYIRKKHIFGYVGEKVFLPQMILPLRCESICIHNNVEIASGARLIPHDAIHGVFNRMEGNNYEYEEHIGKIEIFDNVFIGANALIIGPCKIGPNAIVAAGAIVNRDVIPGSIVGGVPARVIGSFDELKEKRKKILD